ncbi:MAG: ChpI protein [Wenzhouxiangella sp.]|nr:MAG: ChpI protein [Wenzhouxiangella sp.]
MKVAVSVPDDIFRAAEQFAAERNLPRSQVYARALQEYLAQYRSDTIIGQLDDVYASEPSAVDERLLRAQAAVLEDEAW